VDGYIGVHGYENSRGLYRDLTREGKMFRKNKTTIALSGIE